MDCLGNMPRFDGRTPHRRPEACGQRRLVKSCALSRAKTFQFDSAAFRRQTLRANIVPTAIIWESRGLSRFVGRKLGARCPSSIWHGCHTSTPVRLRCGAGAAGPVIAYSRAQRAIVLSRARRTIASHKGVWRSFRRGGKGVSGKWVRGLDQS